jgi:hypothetical protein
MGRYCLSFSIFYLRNYFTDFNDVSNGGLHLTLSVLRAIFGPKRDEVTGGWRKLHNEQLHNLYSSPGVIRTNNSRRRPLRRLIRRWENNINRDLREIEWDSMDWIDLVLDRDQWRTLVNIVVDLRVL